MVFSYFLSFEGLFLLFLRIKNDWSASGVALTSADECPRAFQGDPSAPYEA